MKKFGLFLLNWCAYPDMVPKKSIGLVLNKMSKVKHYAKFIEWFVNENKTDGKWIKALSIFW
jgi:hypothetical protein